MGKKRKKEKIMNEKLVHALEKLIDHERNSTTFYQNKQIQTNWKLNTIRRMVNYQTNEDEAYCDGFPDELVDFIVNAADSEDNLLNCIQYISEYDEQVSEVPISVEEQNIYNIHRLLEEVNFEKRIPDFNERQITFGIVRDIFALILRKSLKEDK